MSFGQTTVRVAVFYPGSIARGSTLRRAARHAEFPPLRPDNGPKGGCCRRSTAPGSGRTDGASRAGSPKLSKPPVMGSAEAAISFDDRAPFGCWPGGRWAGQSGAEGSLSTSPQPDIHARDGRRQDRRIQRVRVWSAMSFAWTARWSCSCRPRSTAAGCPRGGGRASPGSLEPRCRDGSRAGRFRPDGDASWRRRPRA